MKRKNPERNCARVTARNPVKKLKVLERPAVAAIKVFYTPKQSLNQHDGFSKSPAKPRMVLEACLAAGLDIQIVEPNPARLDDFSLAHDREWARKLLAAEVLNGFGTKDEALAASLPYTTGSMVDAVIEAARSKSIAVSLTSGFHHSGFAYNGCFCSANGLIVAAERVRRARLASTVAIVDLDQHFGDGTADIIERIGLNWIRHYSFGEHDINPGNAERWLAELPGIIRSMKPDVVIAQLGADPFEKDPLSSSRLTKDQLRRRDRTVFETCRSLGIGCAFNLAGGYSDPFSVVIEIHVNSIREAIGAIHV